MGLGLSVLVIILLINIWLKIGDFLNGGYRRPRQRKSFDDFLDNASSEYLDNYNKLNEDGKAEAKRRYDSNQ
jgi:hypothetical protein